MVEMLTMSDHVAALSRSCFFYMRQLRSIKQALTLDATRHWYMLSLAVGWTIVTACWLVLVANCYRSYKLFRMLPLISLQELENVSIWLLFYAAFIGYQFDSGSLSRQQFWHTSVIDRAEPGNNCLFFLSRFSQWILVL